jgi:uncharacterized protein (TIGR02145 family)
MGFLPPRMTTAQRDSISSPAKELLIFNIDCSDIQFFNGSNWVPLNNSQINGTIPVIGGNHTPCPNAAGKVYTVTDTISFPYAIGYNWSVPPGATITSGIGTPVITVTFGTQSGYLYVNTYDNCWKSGTGSFRIAVGAPDPPPQGSHTAYEQSIVWVWNRVYGATGYKWNVTNNYSTAIEMHNDTSKTEASLICDSSYTRYVWAYNTCTNSMASTLTKSTSVCPPTCPGIPTISYGGQTYHTVQIGTQCWLKENLNIGIRIDALTDQTNDSIIEKYCYDNADSNCNVYGGLYQWGEAVKYFNGASNSTTWTLPPSGNVTGICPPGWHIPSDAEWNTLAALVGGINVAGGKMKEAGLVHWQSPNYMATNSSGFTGLSGGYCYISNGFTEIYQYGFMWSTAQASNPFYAYPRGMEYYEEQLQTFYSNKTLGHSVRCLKD